jgi:translocation protein SEC66
MAQNEQLRKRMEELQGTVEAEKEWWDKKREATRSEFMKELDQESTTTKTSKASDDEAVLVESGGPAAPQPGGKKKKTAKN